MQNEIPYRDVQSRSVSIKEETRRSVDSVLSVLYCFISFFYTEYIQVHICLC
jgi:hypothetical protein